MDQEQFYLWLDNDLLVDLIRTDIAYLRGNWKKLGRPTMTLPIMRLMLGDPKDWHKNAVWRLIERMNNGYVAGGGWRGRDGGWRGRDGGGEGGMEDGEGGMGDGEGGMRGGGGGMGNGEGGMGVERDW